MRSTCGKPVFDVVSEWILELLACVTSIGLIAAIVAFLRFYDGKTHPDLPLSLTVNSILQLLVTVVHFLFCVALVQGLSQLKWNWFQLEQRPLMSFQAYDDASRGAIGSIRLFVSLGWAGIVNLQGLATRAAAAVMISAALTSTITQQALITRSVMLPLANGTADAPRSTLLAVRSVKDINLAGNYDMLNTRFPIISAMYLGPNRTIPYAAPNCSSADCSWVKYGSLGVCASIVNATGTSDTRLRSEMEMKVTYFLNLTVQASNLTKLIPPDQQDILERVHHVVVLPLGQPSGQFQDYKPEASLGEFVVGYSKGAANIRVTEPSHFGYLIFTLYACTKSFITTIKAGVHNTHETAATSQIISSAGSINYAWNADYQNTSFLLACPFGDLNQSLVLGSPPGIVEKRNYTIQECTGIAVSNIITDTLSGFITLDLDRGTLTSSGEFPRCIVGGIAQQLADQTEQHMDVMFANVGKIIQNIGSSITNQLRVNAASFAETDGTVRGIVSAAQPVIQVRWAWLTLLISQVALSTILLVIVVLNTKSYGVPNLKDSSVAGLCSLDPATRAALGSLDDFGAANKRANTLMVKLQRGSPDSPLWLTSGDGSTEANAERK